MEELDSLGGCCIWVPEEWGNENAFFYYYALFIFLKFQVCKQQTHCLLRTLPLCFCASPSTSPCDRASLPNPLAQDPYPCIPKPGLTTNHPNFENKQLKPKPKPTNPWKQPLKKPIKLWNTLQGEEVVAMG